MAVTELQRAKRALLAVMLALGRLYGCILGVNRDSPDQEVTSALRRTKRAQRAAKAFANGYRNVCKLVVKKQGAASGK